MFYKPIPYLWKLTFSRKRKVWNVKTDRTFPRITEKLHPATWDRLSADKAHWGGATAFNREKPGIYYA